MTGMPGLEDQVVRRRADSRDDDLAEIDEESVCAGSAAVILELECSPGDLGVAQPGGWVLAGIHGAAVKCDSWVAPKIRSSEGATHHAQD